MKNKKLLTLIILILALGILGVGAIAAGAQENSNYPLIVQKLVEKFNLNPDEVMEVFKDAHQERMEERKAHFEERLDELVEQGKITEKQKKAILKKMDELADKREELKDLSPEERREALKEIREDLKEWAEKNDIDLRLLPMFGPKHRGPGGFGPGIEGQEAPIENGFVPEPGVDITS